MYTTAMCLPAYFVSVCLSACLSANSPDVIDSRFKGFDVVQRKPLNLLLHLPIVAGDIRRNGLFQGVAI